MLLVVPGHDSDEPWPTLGPQVCDFLEERSVFGPGSLKGEPYVIHDELRALIYSLYEVHPKGHELAGRRRYKRGGISVRKGLGKTEIMAQIAYAELHPEGPVRCDGFDHRRNPVGRPVRDPYIPLLAVTVDQVEELAYGALLYIAGEGPDNDLFQAQKDGVTRLSPLGKADGKSVPLANSPGARDGARTTFQGFDEPHRLILPMHLAAHETMVANLSKRVMEDPWGLYVGTAGEPGQGSIAEGLHDEARKIAEGKIKEPKLFYFHREASDKWDLTDRAQRIEAIKEATGPIGEFGPGQYEDIADQWDRPTADKRYLERVWTNRWVASNAQAFDVTTVEVLTGKPIPDGAFVTIGFDGSRFRDSTGLVVTDIATGRQRLFAGWERPLDADEWEVPEQEVSEAVAEIMTRYRVWRGYADPPHWTETVGTWSGRWPDQWVEWWTNRIRQMAYACRAYVEAIASGTITYETGRDPEHEKALYAHIAAAGRKLVKLYDDENQQMWILQKIHEDRKYDYSVAAILSWQARLDAISSGAKPPVKKTANVIRVR